MPSTSEDHERSAPHGVPSWFVGFYEWLLLTLVIMVGVLVLLFVKEAVAGPTQFPIEVSIEGFNNTPQGYRVSLIEYTGLLVALSMLLAVAVKSKLGDVHER